MSVDLKTKISQLKISDGAKEALNLSGINILDDCNTYDLDNFRTILGSYTPSVQEEVKKLLRKYGLPTNLKDLTLTDDVVETLVDANIKQTRDLLLAHRSTLYRLFRQNEYELAEINNVFEFYGLDPLTEEDFDEHAELIASQEAVEEIDLDKRIQKKVKTVRKGYGSRTYNHFKIRLASPDEIRMWSYGEVENHETINYRTAKPEEGGLFCEKIFGPTKNYQCRCGKKQVSNQGQVCPKCGVEITESVVRRERMGHIQLEAPVVHTWYLKNTPSRLATLLGIKAKSLEEVVYYTSYIVIDPGTVSQIKKKDVLTKAGYYGLKEQFGNRFTAMTGAGAIKKLLEDLDLDREVRFLRQKYKTSTKQKRQKIIKRLEIVEAFNNSDNKPQWMVMDVIPVIPPDLRPMVQLDGGRFATTDLNDLYRRIINRNERLKKEKAENAPRLIIENEMRMLQVAVDALFDNSKTGKRSSMGKDRPLKSLSDLLRGKQGRFRQNLLGKRVDYSGRSVIIVGPDLKMYQAGIPREMAIILFKPFVLRELQDMFDGDRSLATKKYDRRDYDDDVWHALDNVVKEHPILLNRAPTLHRLGIQAFEPKLIDGKAIRLHPLVTPAFNADFDGDQMAVHVPLSPEAQAEARLLMLASNNILNPKDGKPVVTPSQDMVLGNYFLTIEEAYDEKDESTYRHKNEGKFYASFEEANIAYENGEIGLHTRIIIRPTSLKDNFTEEQKDKYLVTTVGKMIFNSILPDSFPYLNEPTEYNLIEKTPDHYFIEKGVNPKDYFDKLTTEDLAGPFKKKFLSMIIAEVFKHYEITETSKMLDKLKDLGFKYSTVAGITVSFSDMNVLPEKQEILEHSNGVINDIIEYYEMGLLTDEERRKLVIKEWEDALEKIKSGIENSFDKKNHLFMMSDSGARGNIRNFTQLVGMRGLMNNPKGETIEVPVQASFREGLTVSEFFISTHGARKGSTDTALKTAESGYLTRRLVDVAQDVIIVEEDCGTEKGVEVGEIEVDVKISVKLADRIIGRYASKNVVHPETGELICARNQLITEQLAEEIEKAGIEKVEIRSNLTCNSENGVCAKCYGRNLATNKRVEVGEAVGVIAAQSIGEPGTQLTMRTFHTGGVASGSDITQGLPKIQELFEARNPKGKAVISEYIGEVISIDRLRSGAQEVIVKDFKGEEHKYQVDPGVEIIVKLGEEVKPGQKLTDGSINPKELLKVVSVEAAQRYILEEVQKVYRISDIEISDKHIELIIRQMTQRVEVVTEGDTDLLPGLEVSIHEFKHENLKAIKAGKRPAVGRPILLGITRASLRSDSFLSAASFQETTRILADAAIRGKSDELHGLKENVIIGGLIPAGTGILREKSYKYDREPEPDIEPEFEIDIERLNRAFGRR